MWQRRLASCRRTETGILAVIIDLLLHPIPSDSIDAFSFPHFHFSMHTPAVELPSEWQMNSFPPKTDDQNEKKKPKWNCFIFSFYLHRSQTSNAFRTLPLQTESYFSLSIALRFHCENFTLKLKRTARSHKQHVGRLAIRRNTRK